MLILISLVLQKLTEADKLYSSSAAAYMSDPRLCHTTALRLGAATPDNKHGKEEGLVGSGGGEAAGDKLIPVKEEEGVEVGQVGQVGPHHHVVSPGVSWCESVLQAGPDLVPGPEGHQLYMTGESCAVRLTAGTEQLAAVSSCVPNTSHSVFSLSECVVAGLAPQPTTLSSSSSSSSVLPVTVTEVQSWPTI